MNIQERSRHDVTYLAADGMEAAGGIAHGFSTRLGGVSQGMWAALNLGVSRGDNPDHVRENYHRFLTAIGAGEGKLVMTNQVHGGVVRTATSADWKADPYEKVNYEADGLMTATPGVTLMIFSADCIPVLLYDPVRRVIAAAHAGWRGTAEGVVTHAVERMKDVYGCRGGDILAAIGPGICANCFETHEDVPNAMMGAMGTAALPYMEIKENGKFAVDLKGLNARRLEQAGLDRENIAVCGECTACQPDRFWSHRKMGTNRGSMAAAIQLL